MKLELTLAAALTLTLFASPANAESPPPIAGAEQLFAEVLGIIGKEYRDDKLDADGLYSLALRGALDGLSAANGPGTNQLLDPKKLASLQQGIKGQLSGIGVVFQIVERLVIVREVLDGGPAKQAGLQPGDRILKVGSVEVAGKDMQQVADLIRGPQGTTVDLLIQRGVDETVKPITRRMLQPPSVISGRVQDITYLRIRSFSKPAVQALDAALSAALKQNTSGFILDLRGCPGGLLDVSIAVAERFLSKGQRILSTKGRAGKEKVYTVKTSRFALEAPIVVLVDKETASSAEIVAAAISENRRSALVGERTFGKGTVEKVIELSNGYALKLTIARFFSPKGNNWQGRGIQPDFAVPHDPDHPAVYSSKPQLDPERDPQLAAALSVLELLASK